MNDKEKEEWIAQAENSWDFAVRTLPLGSLQEWDQIRIKAEESGLFPSEIEVKIAKKVGIDNSERVIVRDDGTELDSEWFKKLGEMIKKNRELLGIKEKKPLGTVGSYNQDSGEFEEGIPDSELEPEKVGTVGTFNQDKGEYEGGVDIVKDESERPLGSVGSFEQDSKTWKDGVPESKSQRCIKGATVGSYDQDSKQYEGGIEDEQPGVLKTVETVKAKGIPLKVKAGECTLEDCVSCLWENTCPREQKQ
jgi:hypothetical protein